MARESDAAKRKLITGHRHPLLVPADEHGKAGSEQQTVEKIWAALRRCR